jgi:LmbE family N-acetylglucosaminyl deacetylase
MTRVLIVAPHADDESLGCGGTILRHISEGDDVHWLLVTGMSHSSGFTEKQITQRQKEIVQVHKRYGFSERYELNLPPAALDTLAKGDVVSEVSKIIKEVEPEIVYTVYRNDAHSDHEIVFDAVMASTKSFRYPFVRRVLAYETISETDFGMKPEDGGFRPNVFNNISVYLEEKLNILDIYESEMGVFPFPRSRKSLIAIARVRGVQSNNEAAEAFMLIKEIN